jgi:hypothetical protein
MHLAAALALSQACLDGAPNITPGMLRDFLNQADRQEAASVLSLEENTPPLAKRGTTNRLRPVNLKRNATEPIAQVLADPRGRFVVAVPAGADYYFVLSTDDRPTLARVQASGPIASAALAGGHLYVLAGVPRRVDKLDAVTGKSLATVALREAPPQPASLTVLPARGLAFFRAENTVYRADLKTGNVLKTDLPGQAVVAHPNQRLLYSSLRPETRDTSGYILIRGEPIFFEVTATNDWQQTTLFQALVAPDGLLLAGARENAASNGRSLAVSPDGRWVAIAGGGGWRPRAAPAVGSGYGVAVFAAGDLEHLQGFFKIDGHPEGICFNPVTAQVALVRSKDARVYHLAAPETPCELPGPFRGACAWSGNGRYLVVANGGGGLDVFENSLTEDEKAQAGKWYKEVRAMTATLSSGPAAACEPIEPLRTFAVATPTAEQLTALLDKAAVQARTARPVSWQHCPAYAEDEAAHNAPPAGPGDDLGIAIFKLRKALKADPESVPLRFLLAEALRAAEQGEEAQGLYVEVVRGDAGRSDLSGRALLGLASLLAGRDEDMAAPHCLALALYACRAEPAVFDAATPLLQKQHLETQAKAFARAAGR